MWVGAHIPSRYKKFIGANISSTDNQRIMNIFVIIVSMRKNPIKLNYWGQWISHIMKICAEYSGTFQGLIQASMVFQAQPRMFQSFLNFFLKIKAPYCSLGHLLTE